MQNTTQTAIDCSTIEAGRELDSIVAERAMNWIIDREASGPNYIIGHIPDGHPGERMEFVPAYSTNIAAAWEVHTHCCNQIFSKRTAYLKELGELLQNQIADGTGEKVRVAFPDAMKYLSPETICRAALAAMKTS